MEGRWEMGQWASIPKGLGMLDGAVLGPAANKLPEGAVDILVPVVATMAEVTQAIVKV